MLPFVTALVRFVRAIARSWRDPELRGLFAFFAVTLLSGTLFHRQVAEYSFLDSLYFSGVTLTTVGYEDLSPSTASGKVFAILYKFVGLGIVLGFVNAVAEGSQERQSEARERRGQRRATGQQEEQPAADPLLGFSAR